MKALITGASSGLGREMARLLAARGYELILCARREERLRELAAELPVPCRIIAADVSDEQECRLLYEAVQSEELEVVINNAGFGLFGEFVTADLDEELRMIDTNVRAVHILTKLAVRDFVQRGRGYILNVSSSAGFLPGPLMATYYATKNYVLRLTEALREELRRAGSPVRVCALCPGPVDTEFNDRAGVVFALKGITPEFCVQEAMHGMMHRRIIIVPSAFMRACTTAQKLLPAPLLMPIVARQQKKKLG